MTYNPQPPPLKPNVDLQVRHAFENDNWHQTLKLSERRAKIADDPYYEALAVVAESQLESADQKFSLHAAVDEHVRNGSVVKDGDIISIWEWADSPNTENYSEHQYSETYGQLRLRSVKASPRDKETAVNALMLCLLHMDLVNAQQIAAILDKTFPGESRFLFWNILVTNMLASSLQCPPDKKKLYSMLSMKLIERAAALKESGEKSERALKTEEDHLLYFRIQAAQEPEKLVEKLMNPKLGALAAFKEGKKYLLMQALDAFGSMNDQLSIFSVCKEALSTKNLDGSPNMLGCDWTVWQRFISAAALQADPEAAFLQVKEVLQCFLTTGTKTPLPPVYSQVLQLALLEATFQSSACLSPTQVGLPSDRVKHLESAIRCSFDKLASFSNLRRYVEQLTFPESEQLIRVVLPSLESKLPEHRKTLLSVLSLKFRYLLLSCEQNGSSSRSNHAATRAALHSRICKWCQTEVGAACEGCLQNLAVQALEQLVALLNNPETEVNFKRDDVDPVEELIIVAAMCLVNLSGLGRHQSSTNPSLAGVKIHYLLQAVLLLDTHLMRHPDRVQIRVFMVQLHLRLGCASYAYKIWQALGVKRAIIDSLAPLLFDRLSSVAPGMFRSDLGRHCIMEPVLTYYNRSLQWRMPNVVWEAMEGGNYTSVLDITQYIDKLRYSCTNVMAVVEERRGTRALLGRPPALLKTLPRVGSITPKTKLFATRDDGPLCSLECSSVSLADKIRLGPALSDIRSHLDLLSEHFVDLIMFRPPKEFKPVKAVDHHIHDTLYLLENMDRIFEAMTQLLHDEKVSQHLTSQEEDYYTVISLLAALISTILVSSPAQSSTTSNNGQVPHDLTIILETLDTIVLRMHAELSASTSLPGSRSATTSDPEAKPHNFVILAFGSLRTLFLYIATAQVIKSSVTLLLEHQFSTSSKRPSTPAATLATSCICSEPMSKVVSAQIKGLGTRADSSLQAARLHILAMDSSLNQVDGWMDRLAGWTFGNVAVESVNDHDDSDTGRRRVSQACFDAVGGMAGCETWGVKLLESWRMNMKGWAMLKI